tara:strand:- start:118 stop:309 length:192 start_codon:yes stop_codon:yes gene_type:complete
MKIIKVYYKNVYGNDLCYPACINSQLFASISNQKTLSNSTLYNIKKLGYDINIVSYYKGYNPA